MYEQMGKTPHERRYDTSFRGPMIPFGSKIFYRPISTKDKNRLSVQVKSPSRCFHWRKENTASEVFVQRFKGKEVGIQEIGEQFTFLVLAVQPSSQKMVPNRHTANSSRSHAHLVADVFGEEDHGSDLAKEINNVLEGLLSLKVLDIVSDVLEPHSKLARETLRVTSKKQQQQEYNLERLRLTGEEPPPSGELNRWPNPIPAIPPCVVRTPHLHGAPTTEETSVL